jgi:protein SCO1/2
MVAGTLSLVAIVIGLVGLRAGAGGDRQEAAASLDAPRDSARFEGAIKPRGLRAPDFRLRTQDGEPLTMRELRGSPVIVTFLYANCEETCPPQAQQVKGALDALGRDVPVVAVSVDPARDTPAAARRFLAEQGMTGRMEWALGTRERLEPVWKGYAIQPQLEGAEHQAVIALVDGRGVQRIGFPLGQATPDRIAHDVRLLAAEGSGAG